MPFCIGWIENFNETALSCTVNEIEENLCFSIFGKNSKIQNGRHFGGRGKFFENCQEYISQIPCGSKIFDEIALSRTVKEIETNLCFAIFGENSKWPPFLGRGKFFENCQYISPIPCESKISTKSLYLAWLRR